MELSYAGQSGTVLTYSPPHSHKDWELIYNLKGTGTMTVDNVHYPFKPGSILLCPPNSVHSKSSEEGFEDCYLGISGWNLHPQVYVMEDDQAGRISQIWGVLQLTWHEENGKTVCQDLMRGIVGLLQPALSGAESNRYVKILRLRIIARFTDPALKMQELQEDIPINGDYLRRLFRQEQGIAPHEYLTKLRLEHAAHLLRHEGVNVSEAAFRSGFYDPLYFSRLFHRQMGVTPTAWRNQ